MASEQMPNNEFDDIDWLSSEVDSAVSDISAIAQDELELKFTSAKLLKPIDYMNHYVRVEKDTGRIAIYDPVLSLKYGVLCAVQDENSTDITSFELLRCAVMASYPVRMLNTDDYEYSRFLAEKINFDNELNTSVRNNIAYIATFGGFLEGSHIAAYPVCDTRDEKKHFDQGIMSPQHTMRRTFNFSKASRSLTIDTRIHVQKDTVISVTLANELGEPIE